MKKSIIKIVTLVIIAASLSSCEITRPIAVTENPVGKKVGKSTAIGILFFPPFVGMGNSGVQKAAEQGNITLISTVDYTSSYYIIFRKWTCTVTGN